VFADAASLINLIRQERIVAEVSAIVVRVRRVTTEVGYVAVPLTEAIENDLARKESGALAAEACRLAVSADTQWFVEEAPLVEVHPIQKPKT
jgi:hypothetical protein